MMQEEMHMIAVKRKGSGRMQERRILPFYMTYPLPMYYQEEDSVIKDLEYLQQLYPAEAKRYQKVITGILDTLDYSDSMIYDEYPDRIMLRRISLDIQRRCNDVEEIEKKSDLIDVLLCQELLRRRHKEERKFYNY